MHSSVPECAKCHARIDPYGFALEQYDAIGRLRPQEVDTSTTLPSGKKLAGIEGLREYLLNDRREDVVRQFCRKLLGYALGRSIQLSDEPFLDDLIATLAASEYRVDCRDRKDRAQPTVPQNPRSGGHGARLASVRTRREQSGRHTPCAVLGEAEPLISQPSLWND